MFTLYPVKHQARCWLPAFCFPEGGAAAQVCSLSFARKPWPAFWSCSLASYQILLFLWLSLAACTGSWPQRGGGAGLECSVLSVSTGSWRGSAGEVFFVVCGQPSCRSPECSQEEPCLCSALWKSCMSLSWSASSHQSLSSKFNTVDAVREK